MRSLVAGDTVDVLGFVPSKLRPERPTRLPPGVPGHHPLASRFTADNMRSVAAITTQSGPL
jgi:hypothetical protein